MNPTDVRKNLLSAALLLWLSVPSAHAGCGSIELGICAAPQYIFTRVICLDFAAISSSSVAGACIGQYENTSPSPSATVGVIAPNGTSTCVRVRTITIYTCDDSGNLATPTISSYYITNTCPRLKFVENCAIAANPVRRDTQSQLAVISLGSSR